MHILGSSLDQNIIAVKAKLTPAADFYCKEIEICTQKCAILMFEDMASLEKLWNIILMSIYPDKKRAKSAQKLYEYLLYETDLPFLTADASTLDEVADMLSYGFSAILIDGIGKALFVSTQSFAMRSVAEASGEGNIKGSKEGFVEVVRINMGLVRRRIKTGNLRIETLNIGALTKTEVALFYVNGVTDIKTVNQVKRRLQTIDIQMLFDSAYLAPFLARKPLSLFSGINYTERPDTMCAKLCEGKIAIMVDGSPFALIMPYFFIENFQSMDDYSSRPYFASFIRVLKYVSFLLAVMLPAIAITIVEYTPQLMPPQLLETILEAVNKTPLPLFLEAFLVTLLLEIVREAGLRLPKPIGHSVGLIAALIIGDAAVKANLFSSSVILISAITTIATFVVPSLYETVTVLRLGFIVISGFFGPLGFAACAAFMLFNVCAVDTFGIPYTSPITPFSTFFYKDGVLRTNWKKLKGETFNISDLPGARGGD